MDWCWQWQMATLVIHQVHVFYLVPFYVFNVCALVNIVFRLLMSRGSNMLLQRGEDLFHVRWSTKSMLYFLEHIVLVFVMHFLLMVYCSLLITPYTEPCVIVNIVPAFFYLLLKIYNMNFVKEVMKGFYPLIPLHYIKNRSFCVIYSQ